MRDEVIVNTDDKIFVSELVKKLKEKTVCEVKVQKITKNNNMVLTGLCIMQKDCNIAPTIYLEYYKELYEDGSMDMEEIVDHIIQRDQEHRTNSMDVSFFTDFEKVKKDLSFKVINAERNIKLLEKVPHKLSNRRLSRAISADYFRRKHLSQSAVNETKAHYIGCHRRLSRAYFSSAMAGLK